MPRRLPDPARDHGQAIHAVRERRGGAGVLCGPSAAWALGCRLAEATDPVHLVTGGDGWGARSDGVVRVRTDLRPWEVIDTPYGLVTAPGRTAVDLARGIGTTGLPHVRVVAWVDALLRATTLTAEQARRVSAASSGLRGIREARRVMGAARDGVDSPKETELRLLVVSHRFPEPRVQCPVVDAGRVIASLDLGWSEYRVGLEYDGAVHLEYRQHSRDLARLNGVRAVAWNVLQVDAWGLARPRALLQQLGGLVPRS